MFAYRGEEMFDKSTLIYIVVEKYARRFGRLTESQANELYKRMAERYCTGIGWLPCYRSIEIKRTKSCPVEMFAHPKADKDESSRKWLAWKSYQEEIENIKDKVSHATSFADGDYGLLESDGFGYCCMYCGNRFDYTMHIKRLGREKHIYSNLTHSKRTYLSVCRSPLCKSLVDTFPQISRSRTHFPIAKIILELTKNGDRQEKYNEIANRFDGNTKAFIAGRHREKRGKADCSVSH